MKLAVIGSRSFDDYDLLKNKILLLLEKYNDLIIVSGGARGADTLAERFANEYNLEIIIIKPEWDKYGKSAGYIRNNEIWKVADMGIAFWNGQSKGTSHSFELAKKLNKELIVVEYDKMEDWR